MRTCCAKETEKKEQPQTQNPNRKSDEVALSTFHLSDSTTFISNLRPEIVNFTGFPQFLIQKMFAQVARQSARRLPSAVQKPLFFVRQFPTRSFSGVKDFPEASTSAKQLKTTFELPCPTEAQADGNKVHQLTKIVATIGPTSEQLEPLQKVVNAGMKIMRLNFSHATTEEVELRLKNLALCQVRNFKVDRENGRLC